MSLDRPVLASRPPTGAVPFPFVLLEGEEGSGKSWDAALLSASDKVGRTFWLDLGEGAADEYGAIPGVRYEVLVHDGTYAAVLEQVLAVKAEAARAHEAGEPPVVLVIDTMLNVWDGLKDWVGERAREKPENKRKLAADPAAELTVSRNLWNDAGNRYRKLMRHLLTFPGIVVGITRGKWVSDTDPDTGQPYRDGRKTYRIEGEKNLGYDATVVLRMLRNAPPMIVKARSVHAGVKPGTDEPVVLEGPRTPPDGRMLEWLIFDVLKCDPRAAHARDLKSLTGGELLEEERGDEHAGEPAARPPQNTGQQGRQGRQEPPAPPAPAGETRPAGAGPQNGGQGPAGTPPEVCITVARAALVEADVEKLRGTYRDAAGRGVLDVDVLAAVDDSDLAALDLTDLSDVGGRLTLGRLLMAVGKYVTENGAAVRDTSRDAALTAAPAEPAAEAADVTVEDPPEDPWAADDAAAPAA